MDHITLLHEKIRNHIKSVDTGNAILLFSFTALAVLGLCLIGSPIIREQWNNFNNNHHNHQHNPRGASESHRRSIPSQIKSGLKRKRRFAKKDIRAMEIEEKQRKKEEKKEESKAERQKQKKAESGKQKQIQKTTTTAKKANSVETGRQKQKSATSGVRHKSD
ncbi:hypothetical protein CRE_14030 [Caenorhabditis remanei]|uniref:Uncharacterized protein n=1 Tax=Caenorhabditis remanei TaxID=31234 RepID=E3M8W3_CAERE|nr:hypothetical protein CRE_14030 [Caenorhabditis remanei]